MYERTCFYVCLQCYQRRSERYGRFQKTAVFCNNCGVNILDFKEIKETVQAPQQPSINSIEENIPNGQNFNNTYPQGNNVPQNNPNIKLPKLQRYPFSTIAVFFILLGAAAIFYGFFGADWELTVAFSVISGAFALLIGFILLKIDAILSGDIIIKKRK